MIPSRSQHGVFVDEHRYLTSQKTARLLMNRLQKQDTIRSTKQMIIDCLMIFSPIIYSMIVYRIIIFSPIIYSMIVYRIIFSLIIYSIILYRMIIFPSIIYSMIIYIIGLTMNKANSLSG